MVSNKFFLLLFTLLSAITLSYSFNNYFKEEKKIKKEEVMQKYLDNLNDLLQKKKELILTVSLLLSEDKNIKKCIKTYNQKHCEEQLLKSQQVLLNSKLFEDIKIHIHDDKLRSFLRLWEDNKQKNDSLTEFRKSLHLVKKFNKSIYGIEVGVYSMLIRGISPIYEKGKYIGSIEVISDFQSIINYFKNKNIRFYILMDKEYEKIASAIKFKKKQQFNNYVLLNETNKDLSFLNDINLNYTSYIINNSNYILFTPIFDFHTKIIGYYMLKIPL